MKAMTISWYYAIVRSKGATGAMSVRAALAESTAAAAAAIVSCHRIDVIKHLQHKFLVIFKNSTSRNFKSNFLI